MSTKYFALLTRLGADKLANAAALGTKIEIAHMAVGDGGGSLPTPHTTQTQLINERRRAAINVLSIDPKNTNQIIAEQVIPESEGGWWIREIGLFDKDGILIAVGNCAETYKPQLQEGSGRTQTLRMVLIVSSTDAVTLKIDPSVVLATREYVDSRVTSSIKDHENSRHHPDATLKDKGFVILSSAVDSHSETQAATPKAVKVAYDLANAARDNANGRVPATRKINGKALSSDISLGAGDVGAYTPGEVDSRVNEAKSLANTASQNAANANNNANSRLEKKQNGADIPDPKRFVENLGLAETKKQAENAFPAVRVGVVKNGVNLDAIRSTGYYQVDITEPNTVNNWPSINGRPVYSWGVLRVETTEAGTIQAYHSHDGDLCVRVSYVHGANFRQWNILNNDGFVPRRVGDQYFSPHPDRVPGEYVMTGEKFSVDSPPGIALRSLPVSYKSAWRIVETDGYINVPNYFTWDGRGYF
ncbi:phage tail protein, partial [Xenorhabdus bovienii]|uniref:phage tail protein n=1 Tax=Xenorhabdus bovienii TaxID=40576 RepID=UPI0023B23793